MSIKTSSKLTLLAGAAIAAGLAAPLGAAQARTLPGVMGQFNTIEINGVKFEDCVVYQQTGSVMNTCKNAVEYHVPLPIDSAGKKSVTITAETDSSTLVTPVDQHVTCTLRASDKAGKTLVLATGRTQTLRTVSTFTINSHPVPAGGRLNLHCILPFRSSLHTVDYTP